ncbi:MAG: aminotransferase class I/II-fold pyridoxal phosphate-dependent enzyme [Treponema sp.]|nr:aminotransferase class I/II-fold pyridoxal phosphate-dependent enzyme [Candidatus Treponema equifaecale]
MIRFNNDYNHGALPQILEALSSTNDTAFGGYGTDDLSESARKEIKKYLDFPEAQVHFLIGGTQVNYVAIASMLRPFQSVICAESGHINVHETGAVENTGHKIIGLPHVDGKISAAQIEKIAADFEESPVQEHITQPKMVYISQPTEYGTIYSKEELIEISSTCAAHDLYLFVDGARLGYALGSAENDVTLSDLANLTDMFYIGGTKCGALFGEALVITNKELQPNFRSYIKQNGAMLAKGWLLGIQFETMFKDGLYFKTAEQACKWALEIRDAFHKKGIKSYIESPTNQQFFAVTDEVKSKLAENFIFEDEGKTPEGLNIIRFCTSWSTKQEEVDELLKKVGDL